MTIFSELAKYVENLAAMDGKLEGVLQDKSVVVLCSLVEHPIYSALNFTPFWGNGARELLMKQEPESLCQVSHQCKLPFCYALAGCLLSYSVINPSNLQVSSL